VRDHSHSRLIAVVESAVKRGAHVYFQFWKNSISEARDTKLGMGWNVDEQAKQLRALGIHAFVDDGRGINYKWDTHIKAVVFDRHVALVGGIDIVDDRWDTKEHLLPDEHRRKCPDRMTGYCEPWQDAGVIVDGTVASDVAALAYHRQRTYCDQIHLPFISDVPGNCGHRLPAPADTHLPPYTGPYTHAAEPLKVLDHPADTCSAVISGHAKNLGVNKVTKQIHERYVQAISKSTRYVYIENQYLIAKGINEIDPQEWLDLPVLGHWTFAHARNEVLSALHDRLKRAIDICDPKFSVVIVAPLAPFESFLLYLNWRFMFDPEQGLIPNLKRQMQSTSCTRPLSHFLSYNFLANKHQTNDTHATWYSIFVHSKLMVVDDIFATVGSANINDRSLWGRDGELNINIDGEGASRVRAALFSSHLGSFADQAAMAATDSSDETLAEVFHRAGTHNVDSIREHLRLDFATGIDHTTGRRIMDIDTQDFMTYAIGSAWIGPRQAQFPKDDPNSAGQLFKHGPAIWGDGSKLQQFMTDLSNAFV